MASRLRTTYPGDGQLAEFGRYAFPAIGPLAVYGGRFTPRLRSPSGAAAAYRLLVAMLALSYAAQLLTLTSFYA